MPLYHDPPEGEGPEITIGIEVSEVDPDDWRESDYIRSHEEIVAERTRAEKERGQ